MSIEQILTHKRAMKNQRYHANMNYIALQNNYFFPPNNGYNYPQMPGMMDQMQLNPYMMPHIGQMNLPPYQINYMQGMNPQIEVPQEENDQQQN